jgi:protein-S-isoprenylcysteine O-methyltransferase Ste14
MHRKENKDMAKMLLLALIAILFVNAPELLALATRMTTLSTTIVVGIVVLSCAWVVVGPMRTN